MAETAEKTVFDHNELVPTGQVRLSEISVFNWGTFKGVHTVRVHPNGTLITGETGAGKSTLVDAVQSVLLRPTASFFNTAAAQGDQKDRSLVTYVRGKVGEKEDGIGAHASFLRDGSTYSAVRVRFDHENGRSTVLMAVFWITGASVSLGDVRREYLVAQRDISIKEVLETIRTKQGEIDRTRLHTRYEPDRQVQIYRKFDEYFAAYLAHLHIDNEKAPALLIRAMGLKRIDNLTKLIRDFVLEPGEARDYVRTAVDDFRSLDRIHASLVDARRQRDALARLPDLKVTIDRTRERLKQIAADHQALPVHLARQACALYDEAIAEADRALEDLRSQLSRKMEERDGAGRRVDTAQSVYLQSGGERVNTLKRDLEEAQGDLKRAQGERERFLGLAEALGFHEGHADLTRDAFAAIHHEAGQLVEGSADLEDQALNAYAEAFTKHQNLEVERKAIETELVKLASRRRASNLPDHYLDVRDEMVKTLGFDEDELVFIAELIEVKSDEARWQGAIERALGGRRLTLLAPESKRGAINAYLNARHLGLNLRVEGVEPVSGGPQFREKGFLRKLEWRQHPYRDALKHLLRDADLTCVETVEALNETPYSMTVTGLVHRSHRTSEKRDLYRVDDQSQWFTGFSSATRVRALQDRIDALTVDLDAAAEQKARAYDHQRHINERLGRARELHKILWSDIDIEEYLALRDEIQKELDELLQSSEDLSQAKMRLDAAKQELSDLQEQVNKLDADSQVAEEKRQSLISSRERQASIAGQDADEGALERLDQSMKPITRDDLSELAGVRSEMAERIGLLRERTQRERHAAESAAGRDIGVYKNTWEAEAAELSEGLDFIDDYITIYERIVAERLPELEDRFKKKLIRNADQSLMQIINAIEEQTASISERIEAINEVLEEVEFTDGTLLEIKPQHLKLEPVRRFEAAMNAATLQAASRFDQDFDTDEALFDALRKAMEVLGKASDPATAGNLESLQMLDARYRMDFAAHVIDRQTHESLEVIRGTGGKSGGEKESFSGFIVAASLAFALTPAGATGPKLCTVFLDEAFSNTSQTVIRRVLSVFRHMGLHLNLITPFKNLDIAREAARQVSVIERPKGVFESRVREVTWEELGDLSRNVTLREEAQRHGLMVEGINDVAQNQGEPPDG